jgi:hypothetical protein
MTDPVGMLVFVLAVGVAVGRLTSRQWDKQRTRFWWEV